MLTMGPEEEDEEEEDEEVTKQTSDVIGLRETPVVSIVLRNV